MMKRYISGLMVLVFVLSFAPVGLDAQADKEVSPLLEGERTVAFLYEGKKGFLEDQASLIKDEIDKLMGSRYEMRYVERDGGFDEDKIAKELTALLRDKNVDAVICLGFMTGYVAANERDLTKPVILADVYDSEAFDLPYYDGASGRENFTYTAVKGLFAEDVRAFRQLIKFSKLHILVGPERRGAVQNILNRAEDLRGNVEVIEYKDTVTNTMGQIDGEDVEAVFYGISDRFSGDYRKELIGAVNTLRIPTFSILGMEVVEQGVLGGLVPKFYGKFARRVALNLDRIFRGEEASKLPVDFYMEQRFVINARTARDIGVSIPFRVAFDAKILHPYEEWGSLLSMELAVKYALENNLLFDIKDEEIRSAGQEHLIQWSNYLPQIRYSLEFETVDNERAIYSALPKRQLTNRFTLNQIIFSDPLITDIANSRKDIFIERLSRNSQELDVTNDTSRAYLDYLISKAILKVVIDDMETTRHNLSIAEKRYKIGAGGREEVYRWESELSDKQSRVILAESDLHVARVALNQLMNVPLESPFIEEDVTLEMMKYYLGGKEIDVFLDDPERLGIFLDFNVEEGLKASPELAALDLGIQQQKETKGSAFKRFFLPEASLTGSINPRVRRTEYGPTRIVDDHTDWSLGIDMSYPIFEGGEKVFDLEKQKAELARLVFKEELAAQLTEKEIRDSAYRMYYSLPNIELTKKAMESSAKNYDIVAKKYAEGTVSITDLIDAQNDKFTRESSAVIAVYQFLQDLSSFDRAVSKFLFFANEEERQLWLDNMRQYFADRGVGI